MAVRQLMAIKAKAHCAAAWPSGGRSEYADKVMPFSRAEMKCQLKAMKRLRPCSSRSHGDVDKGDAGLILTEQYRAAKRLVTLPKYP